MRRDRAGFSLLELIIASVVILMVLTTMVLVGRQFLYNMIWSGETFTGIHEAALLEGTLRRDLARTAAAGSALAVETGPGRLKITLPAGSRPATIEYRLDPVARALVRGQDGQPGTPLAIGLVRAFGAVPRFVVARAGRLQVVAALEAGDRVQRAGLLLELTIKGQAVAGNEQAAQGLTLNTHVFPHFANLALATIWRPAGGKQ